jgi:hypothetical protein
LTVSNTTSVVQFAGNGATVGWPTGFRFFKNTDLVVVKRSVAGVTTPLNLNTDYSVAGANSLNGGTVTTTTPLAVGELLTIARVLNVQQLTDLRNQGNYFAEIHEDVFDYLTMLIQQTGESDARSLRHPRDQEHYQAEGRRIVDLEDPVDPQDAATKSWVGKFIDMVSGAVNTVTGIAYDAGTLFDFLKFGNARSVDSIAALRLLSGVRNQRATTLGYYQKGDGGGGDFYVDPADTTTADNGFNVIVGADGARWKLALSAGANIHQAGAVGDGVANDTAAFTRMNAAGFPILLLAKKTYLVDNLVINNSAGIFGAGQHDGGSVIRANTATGSVITFSGPSTSPISIIDGVKFDTRVVRTGGSFVAFTGFGRSQITNFTMWEAFDGISVNASTSVTIGNGLIYSSRNGDIKIIAGFTLYIYNVITDHDAVTQPLYGLSILSCGDITVSDSSFLHAGNALVMDVPDGQYITSAWFDNVFFDTSLRGAFIRSGGTGNIQRCRWDCCWFGSHTNQGVLIQKLGSGSIEGLHWVDCHAMLNAVDGFRTQGAVKDVLILGGEYAANGVDGISFGANATSVTVQGAFSGAYGGLSGNRNGIYVEANVENYVLLGNQLNGNTAGAIANLNPGANNSIIAANMGYRTSTRGNSTIPSGSTSVVVAHSLLETPAVSDIRLSPTSGWGAATQWWISNVTASSFTINVNNNPTVSINFGWEAKTPSSKI